MEAAPLYLFPAIEVHAGELAIVGLSNVDVQGLALVDEGPSVCRHLQDGFLRDLPNSLVELLQVIRDLRDVLEGAGVFQCGKQISDSPDIPIYNMEFFSDSSILTGTEACETELYP